MKKSAIFFTDEFTRVEATIVDLINSQKDFMSARTAASTRAAGDAIQNIIGEAFEGLLGKHCAEYSAEFARRAMADLAFTDKDGFYYVVDVKTHRLETAFNMPNLTSVKSLARLYESDNNYFVILMVQYSIDGVKVKATHAHFVPIEFLGWECLTVGALGWGQIQIANANVVKVNPGYSRKKWMLELCDILLDFYPKEIGKIGERIGYFEKVRERWAKKED